MIISILIGIITIGFILFYKSNGPVANIKFLEVQLEAALKELEKANTNYGRFCTCIKVKQRSFRQ